MITKESLLKDLKFFVFLFLIVLSSCTFFQQKEKVTTEAEIRRGVEGLSIQFSTGTPPSTVFESDPTKEEEGIFQTSITLHNKGAYDINSGILALSYEEAYLKTVGSWNVYGEPTSQMEDVVYFKLGGRSLNNPAGESIVLSKNFKTKKLEEKSESHTTTIYATACYDYETKVAVPICIDPNPYDTTTRKACTVSDITLNDQGAPVAVTKVETRMLPKGQNRVTPEVKIYIQNKGNGEVVNKERLSEACTQRVSIPREIWNVVSVADLNIAEGEGFRCSPLPFKLKEKQDYVLCIYNGEIDADSAFTTLLNIRLEYGYTQTIAASTTIEKNPALHQSQ